ncbi:MAG: NigD-like protein [Bacteroides sp.]
MKKFNLIALSFWIAIIPFFQSCMSDGEPVDSFVISTIKVPDAESKDYYFLLDNGKKMFPSITDWVKGYEAKEGQRAFVLFRDLEQTTEGYDYSIEVKRIENILTKDIIDLTAENEAEIGDDGINTTYMWIAQGYLTIEFQYYGTNSSDKKHYINLVNNTLNTEPNPDEEYIELEFRHNAEGDAPAVLGEGYVSFKLNSLADQMEGKKGLKIRVKTIYEGTKLYTVDFK